MADFELHGYLTTGKFQVNDYEIEIERVDGGVRMMVTDGKGNVQQEIIRDGDPALTDDEVAAIRQLFEQMSIAFPEWQDNENARKAAEGNRDASEGDRNDLYNRMLALFNRLHPIVDTDLTAIDEAVRAAQAAQAGAEAAAEGVRQNVYNDLVGQMYFWNNDVLSIGKVIGDSHSLNLAGYCVADKTEVHLKMPVAKRLDKITSAYCNSFRVHLVNGGGYGSGTSFDKGGTQYASGSYVAVPYVDRVQNCIHIKITKANGGTFNLSENECVSARIGDDANDIPAVMITLEGDNRP